MERKFKENEKQTNKTQKCTATDLMYGACIGLMKI